MSARIDRRKRNLDHVEIACAIFSALCGGISIVVTLKSDNASRIVWLVIALAAMFFVIFLVVRWVRDKPLKFWFFKGNAKIIELLAGEPYAKKLSLQTDSPMLQRLKSQSDALVTQHRLLETIVNMNSAATFAHQFFELEEIRRDIETTTKTVETKVTIIHSHRKLRINWPPDAMDALNKNLYFLTPPPPWTEENLEMRIWALMYNGVRLGNLRRFCSCEVTQKVDENHKIVRPYNKDHLILFGSSKTNKATEAVLHNAERRFTFKEVKNNSSNDVGQNKEDNKTNKENNEKNEKEPEYCILDVTNNTEWTPSGSAKEKGTPEKPLVDYALITKIDRTTSRPYLTFIFSACKAAGTLALEYFLSDAGVMDRLCTLDRENKLHQNKMNFQIVIGIRWLYHVEPPIPELVASSKGKIGIICIDPPKFWKDKADRPEAYRLTSTCIEEILELLVPKDQGDDREKADKAKSGENDFKKKLRFFLDPIICSEKEFLYKIEKTIGKLNPNIVQVLKKHLTTHDVVEIDKSIVDKELDGEVKKRFEKFQKTSITVHNKIESSKKEDNETLENTNSS